MELTEKHLKARLDWLKELVCQAEKPDGSRKELDALTNRLHEKGVECAILIPLMEVALECDTLRDVAYEQSSETKYGQRFDFLIDETFLLEAKQLNADLADHAKQIERYINDNPKICYGILTNGVDFQIWLKREYIQKVTDEPLPHCPAVKKAVELSLADEHTTSDRLIDILSLFKRGRHEKSFEAVAAAAAYYARGGRGRPPIIHKDRETNQVISDEIEKAFAIHKGVYYNHIVEKKLNAGDRLEYKDESVQIVVEVTDTGNVKLRRGNANVLNLVKAKESGWGPLCDLILGVWSKDEPEFDDPLEIIRRGQGKKRLFNKERYDFKRIK